VTAPVWRKSSRSGTEQNACVELAALLGRIAVRDSKDPNGPHLEFTPDDWRAFTHRVRNGDHDPT
jgi:hypothetical protein